VLSILQNFERKMKEFSIFTNESISQRQNILSEISQQQYDHTIVHDNVNFFNKCFKDINDRRTNLHEKMINFVHNFADKIDIFDQELVVMLHYPFIQKVEIKRSNNKINHFLRSFSSDYFSFEDVQPIKCEYCFIKEKCIGKNGSNQIELMKNEKVSILESSIGKWWLIQRENGQKCYVSCYYLKIVTSKNLKKL
jgi:hypothetical protein